MSDKKSVARDFPQVLADKNNRNKRKVYRKRSSLYQNVLSSSSSSSYGRYSARAKLTPRSSERKRKLRLNGASNKFLSHSTPSLFHQVPGFSQRGPYSEKTSTATTETSNQTTSNASKSGETSYTSSMGTKSTKTGPSSSGNGSQSKTTTSGSAYTSTTGATSNKTDKSSSGSGSKTSGTTSTSGNVYTSTVNTESKQTKSTRTKNEKRLRSNKKGSLVIHADKNMVKSDPTLATGRNAVQKSRRPDDFSKNCLPNWTASSVHLFDGTRPNFEPKWQPLRGARSGVSDSSSEESLPNCIKTSTTGLEQYYKEYKKNKFRATLPPGFESNESLRKLQVSKAEKGGMGRRASDMLMEMKRTQETRKNVEKVTAPLLRHVGKSHTGVSVPKTVKHHELPGAEEGDNSSTESQPGLHIGETSIPVVKHPSDSAVTRPSDSARKAKKAAGTFRGNLKLLGSSSEHRNAGRVHFQQKKVKPLEIKPSFEEEIHPRDTSGTSGRQQFMTTVGREVPVDDHIVLVGKLRNEDGTYKKTVILGKLHQRGEPEKALTGGVYETQLFGSGDSALSLPPLMAEKPPPRIQQQPGAYGEGQNIVKESEPEQFLQKRIRRMSVKVGGKLKRFATDFRQNFAHKRRLSRQELFSMNNMQPLREDSVIKDPASVLSSDETSFEFGRFNSSSRPLVIGRKRSIRTPQGGARGRFLMRIPNERENPFSANKKLADKLKLLRIDMLHDIDENLKKWRRREVEFPESKKQIDPKCDFTFNQLLNRSAMEQETGKMKDGMRLLRRPSRASSLGLSSTGSWYSGYLHSLRSDKSLKSTNNSFYRTLSNVVQGLVKIGADERGKRSVPSDVSDHVYDEVPSSDDLEIFKNGILLPERVYDTVPDKSKHSVTFKKSKRTEREKSVPEPMYDLVPRLSDESKVFKLSQNSDGDRKTLKEISGFIPGQNDGSEALKKSTNSKQTKSATKHDEDLGRITTLSRTSRLGEKNKEMRINTPASSKKGPHTANDDTHSSFNLSDVMRLPSLPSNVTNDTFNPDDLSRSIYNLGDVRRSISNPSDVTRSVSNPSDVTRSVSNPSDVTPPVSKASDVKHAEYGFDDITPSPYDSNDFTNSAYGSGDVTHSENGDVRHSSSTNSEQASTAPPPSAGFRLRQVKKCPKGFVQIGRRHREMRTTAADVASGDQTTRNVTFSLPLAAGCPEAKPSSANESAPRRHRSSCSNIHRVLDRLSQAAIGRNSEYWLTKGQSVSLPIYNRETFTERTRGMRKSLSLEPKTCAQGISKKHKGFGRDTWLTSSRRRSRVVIGRRHRARQNISVIPEIRTGPRPTSSLSTSRRSSQNTYGYDEVASEREPDSISNTATKSKSTSNQVSMWSGTDPSRNSGKTTTKSSSNDRSNATNQSSNYSSSLTSVTERQSAATYDDPPTLGLKSSAEKRVKKGNRSGKVPADLGKTREVPGFPGSISVSGAQRSKKTSNTSETSTEYAGKLMKFFEDGENRIKYTSTESLSSSVKLIPNIHGQNPTTLKSGLGGNSSQSLPSNVSSELDVFGKKLQPKRKFPKGLLKLGAMDFSSTNVSQLTTWFDRSTVTELTSEKSSIAQSSDETDEQITGDVDPEERLQRKKELEEKATIMYLRGDGIVMRTFQCRDREVVGNLPALAKGKNALGKNEIPMSLKYTLVDTKRKACTDANCLHIKCATRSKALDTIYDPEGPNEVTLKDVKDLMKKRNLSVYDPVTGPPGAKPLCRECPIRTKRFTPFFPDLYANRTLKPLASRVVDFACYEGKNLYIRSFLNYNEEEVDNYCEQFALKALVLGISRYMTEEAIDTSLLDVKSEEFFEGVLTSEIGAAALDFGAMTYSEQCIKDAKRLRIIENYIAGNTFKSAKPTAEEHAQLDGPSNKQDKQPDKSSIGKYKNIDKCKIPAPPTGISTTEVLDDYLDSFDEDDEASVEYTSLPTKFAALQKMKTGGKLKSATTSARIASGAKIKSLNHMIELLNTEAQSLQKLLPDSPGFKFQSDDDVEFIVYKMVCQVSISSELISKGLATGVNRKRFVPTSKSVQRIVGAGLKQLKSVTSVVSSATQTSMSSDASREQSLPGTEGSRSSSDVREKKKEAIAFSSEEDSSSLEESSEEELSRAPSTSRRAPSDETISRKTKISRIRRMFGARRRRKPDSPNFSSTSVMLSKRRLPKTIKRFFHKLLKQGGEGRRRKSVTFDDNYLEHWKSSTSSLSSSGQSSDYYVMKLERKTSPAALSLADSTSSSEAESPNTLAGQSPRERKKHPSISPYPSAGASKSKPTKKTSSSPEKNKVFGTVPESLVEKFGNIARRRTSDQRNVGDTDEQPGSAFFETAEPTRSSPSAGVVPPSDESDYVVLRVLPRNFYRICENEESALDLLSVNYESDTADGLSESTISQMNVHDNDYNRTTPEDTKITRNIDQRAVNENQKAEEPQKPYNQPIASEEKQKISDSSTCNNVAIAPSGGPRISKHAPPADKIKNRLPEMELVDQNVDTCCDSQSQMSLRRYCIVGKDWERRQRESGNTSQSSCNSGNVTIGFRERNVGKSSGGPNSSTVSIGKRIGEKLSCRGQVKTRPSADMDAATSAYLFVQDSSSGMEKPKSKREPGLSAYEKSTMSPKPDESLSCSMNPAKTSDDNNIGGDTMKVVWKRSEINLAENRSDDSDLDSDVESCSELTGEADSTPDGVKDLVDELNTELQRVVSWAEDAGFDTSNLPSIPKQQDSNHSAESERFCAEISSSLVEIQTSLAQFEKMVSDFKPPGGARESPGRAESTAIQFKLLEAVDLLRAEVLSLKTNQGVTNKITHEGVDIIGALVSPRGLYSSENSTTVPVASKRVEEPRKATRWCRTCAGTENDTDSSYSSRNHHCCRSHRSHNVCCAKKPCIRNCRRFHPYQQRPKHKFKVKFAPLKGDSESMSGESDSTCQEFVSEAKFAPKEQRRKEEVRSNMRGRGRTVPAPSFGPTGIRNTRKVPLPRPRSGFTQLKQRLDCSVDVESLKTDKDTSDELPTPAEANSTEQEDLIAKPLHELPGSSRSSKTSPRQNKTTELCCDEDKNEDEHRLPLFSPRPAPAGGYSENNCPHVNAEVQRWVKERGEIIVSPRKVKLESAHEKTKQDNESVQLTVPVLREYFEDITYKVNHSPIGGGNIQIMEVKTAPDRTMVEEPATTPGHIYEEPSAQHSYKTVKTRSMEKCCPEPSARTEKPKTKILVHRGNFPDTSSDYDESSERDRARENAAPVLAEFLTSQVEDDKIKMRRIDFQPQEPEFDPTDTMIKVGRPRRPRGFSTYDFIERIPENARATQEIGVRSRRQDAKKSRPARFDAENRPTVNECVYAKQPARFDNVESTGTHFTHRKHFDIRHGYDRQAADDLAILARRERIQAKKARNMTCPLRHDDVAFERRLPGARIVSRPKWRNAKTPRLQFAPKPGDEEHRHRNHRNKRLSDEACGGDSQSVVSFLTGVPLNNARQGHGNEESWNDRERRGTVLTPASGYSTPYIKINPRQTHHNDAHKDTCPFINGCCACHNPVENFHHRHKEKEEGSSSFSFFPFPEVISQMWGKISQSPSTTSSMASTSSTSLASSTSRFAAQAVTSLADVAARLVAVAAVLYMAVGQDIFRLDGQPPT